ncbi:DivIVA domain-containing protein [Georgenia alba]|uniref:Cell wall synthesis protein Wag31 n=1 Tax=Georgenia alba TaxID=2233858 RepID=A0ABW2Q826_9MICO
MALLTADDVLNKKFQPTKFREGYDQDEVDDFLDEVVNTLRVVGGENEELKAKLEAAEARIAELTGSPGPASPDVAAEPEETAAPAEEAPAAAAMVTSAPPAAAAEEQPAPAGGESGPAPESAAGMLALAQRLHDEYVSNGKAESERLVSEAQAEGERIIKEAEDQHNRTLTQLEQERSLLERKIDELRTFERDYRTRLKSYLESLLQNVESGAPKAEGI